jgi:aspartate aminotransferase
MSLDANGRWQPAERVRRIRDSPSSAAAAQVRTLVAAGEEIIDLTVGQPDADTPQNIKDAAHAAIERGETSYTPVNGTPALRRAIRDRMLRRTGLQFEDAQITVGGGGKQVIFMALAASLDPGDEVIVPAPYWVSYPDMVLANEGTPVVVETSADTGFLLTPEQLESAITPSTAWVILNTPSNPTGATYDRAQLQALGEVLVRHPHVRVLVDEIYDEIVFTPQRPPSTVAALEGLQDRVLTVNGVSKTYAMTGWRLGYAVGDPALIGAINKLQSQVSSCPSSISQAAAVEALDGDQGFVERSVEVYRSRRDLALERFGAIPGLVPVRPDGAFYLFVDCRGLIGRRTPDGSRLDTDQDVVLYLLQTARVATIQGSAYGAAPYFRLSFATDEDTLARGAQAVAEAVALLQ